jgi:hypothetical protein
LQPLAEVKIQLQVDLEVLQVQETLEDTVHQRETMVVLRFKVDKVVVEELTKLDKMELLQVRRCKVMVAQVEQDQLLLSQDPL